MQVQKVLIVGSGDDSAAIKAALQAAGAKLVEGHVNLSDDDGAWSIEEVKPEDLVLNPNTLYVIGTDADGKMVLQGTRSSFDASRDYQIMAGALELSQAVELRGVTFDAHKIGGLVVLPAKGYDKEKFDKLNRFLAQGLDDDWKPIPKDLAPGRYLVTVATDSGAETNILQWDGKGWEHEGEYTFQHGYFYRPVMYKAAPAPAELPAEQDE